MSFQRVGLYVRRNFILGLGITLVLLAACRTSGGLSQSPASREEPQAVDAPGQAGGETRDSPAQASNKTSHLSSDGASGLDCGFDRHGAGARPVRLLPLGDSITYRARKPVKQPTYRYRLWKLFLDNGLQVDFIGSQKDQYAWEPHNGRSFDLDNEGHRGQTYDFINRRLPSWLKDYTPDVVLVYLGANDVRQEGTLRPPVKS